VEDIYPVTPLQLGLLVSMIQDPAAYVLQIVFDIRGDFTLSQLQQCWVKLALEIPMLRTVFVSTREGIFQAITKGEFSEWETIQEVWPSAEVDSLTHSFVAADRSRGFTLQSTSFNRFTGIHLTDGRLRVVWTHHHSLMDGWSLPLVMNRLMAICYGDEGVDTFVPFKEHVEWLAAQDPEPSRLFWSEALRQADETSSLTLPPPHPNTIPLSPYNRITRTLSLPNLDVTCKALQVTPSSIFRTVWAILLHQYTRSEYVVFGTVVSGRNTDVDGVEKIVGMLINTIPILVHVEPNILVTDLISQVHEFSSSSAHHSHWSLIDVKKWGNAAHEVDLFDSLLVYENYPSTKYSVKNTRKFSIDVKYEEEYAESKLSIAISPSPLETEYDISIMSNALEIDIQFIELIADRFEFIAKSFLSLDARRTIESMDHPGKAENEMIYSSCFGPEVPLKYDLLHHAFEDLAKSNPDDRAVEFETDFLSYGELDGKAGTLAYELASVSVGVGSRVAIIMDRCLEFSIGLLATLKVGAAMVPLDATFPINRLISILSDSDVSAIITTRKFIDVVQSLRHYLHVVHVAQIDISCAPQVFKPLNCHKAARHNEAFVVFTSGSTGRPKGVPVLHFGAVNCIENTIAEARVTKGMRVMQFMSIGFDACQWEIWKTLSVGATLVFRSQNWLETLLTVDMISCTSTALAQLGDPCKFPNLKYVAVGGESLPSRLKDEWSPYVCLMNSYGPTECSILTHYQKMNANCQITIGSPIANVNSYILDESQGQVPLGVIGELYLGGICVSPGYINLADETSERFLPDPFSPTRGQMFRTGDLARLLPNGHFEILGRQDSQVKLKGYRIELDEVANAMKCHPRVVAAAAIVKSKSHLVGYYTPASINISELQEVVASHLPVYMVPVAWVGLDEMPQNTNGKIDKKALEAFDVMVETEELETDTEKRMAAVWATVLNIDVAEIGRQTSFFSVGGDSLSVIKVVAACKEVG
ncbi:hypothetical protein As57867_005722, partial [Aphanomyces stellatus]